MARLPADENIHPRIVGGLRAAGHDLATVYDLGLIGAEDPAILEAANREGRILISADKDFGAILEFGALAGRGRVILLRYRLLNWDRITRDLTAVISATLKEFESDPRLLVVIEEGQYRIRRYA